MDGVRPRVSASGIALLDLAQLSPTLTFPLKGGMTHHIP